MNHLIRACACRWALFAAIFLALPSGGAHALTDPTRPPGSESPAIKAVPERSLAVDAIVFGADRRVAVIEGEALSEGQRHDSVRVVRIYANRVLVTDNGRERVLYLDRLPQVRGTQ